MTTRNRAARIVVNLALGLAVFGAARADVLYQEDFNSYAGVKYAADYGWSFSATYGGYGWGLIQDQGTGTGPCLWAINGWTHPLTSTITGTNGTKIIAQTLMWPQWGSVSAGLYSLDFSSFFYPGWSGAGPRMNYGDGKLTLIQPDAAGGASSAEAIVSGVTPATACFTMVIDLMAGTADVYLGSVETGNLLIAGFDLKGAWSLSQFQSNMTAYTKFGVVANQGVFDSILVTALDPQNNPASYSDWQAFYFTQAQCTDPFISGATASPLGDGLPNQLKFALGRSPWERFTPVVSTGPLPDGRPAFVLKRRLDAANLGLQIEASTDLAAWSSAPGSSEITVIANDSLTETIRVSPPSGVPFRRWFLRLRLPGS